MTADDPAPPDAAAGPGARRRFLHAAVGTAAGLTLGRPAAASAAAGPEGGPWPSLTDAAWHPPGARAVTGDGTTDDTAAIQRVVDAAADPSWGVAGGYLVVPPGDYLITDTITIRRFAGIIQGSGVGHTPGIAGLEGRRGAGSTFRWGGPADRPMVRIVDSFKLNLRDLRFRGDDDRTPSAALDLRWEDRPLRGENQGTNSELVIEGCHFGAWPWPGGGDHRGGRVAVGVLVSGDNGNNDQFSLLRCRFNGRPGARTWGVRIDNSQSVWGSITDCTFDRLDRGLETNAAVTVVNPQFNRCGTDLTVLSTAQVDVFGWQSEHAGRLARLGRYGGLRVVGGQCQIDPETLGPDPVLIDAFPSQSSTVTLQGVRFTWLATHEGGRGPAGGADPPARPGIRFGPSEEDGVPAAGPGFLIRVDDCVGLHADQCQLVGTMYASVPRSRGIVEWFSRNREGIAQFRNELWHRSAGPGTRETVDPNSWDVPRPGTRN